jgi:RimJ/RimL family protein N-acetyltransferase
MPSIDNFEDFMLQDIKEMKSLELKGYKFISRRRSSEIALNDGVIIFCLFINKELAHVGRLALTEKAKRYVDNLPFKVDFYQGEACTGGTWTSPKFRGNGFMKYGYYQRFEFLRGLGIKTSRNAVNITNIASRRVHEKFNPEIYGEAKYRRLFFIFKFWNEKPWNHPSNEVS